MKYTIYKNLYQLTAFSPIFPINAYIYEEDSYLTIIDVGINGFVQHFEKVASQLDKPIKFVILTHPHADHVGGLDLLKKTFPEIRIVFSKRDSRLLNGDFSLDSDELQEEIKGGFKKILSKPDILVKDGENIGSLSIIATPGHTPGSISLYDNKNKILISGDALQTKGGFAIAGDKQPLFPFPALATWNKREALQSVKKLENLQIDCLAPGHGKLLIKPHFKKAIERLERQINEEKNK